MLDGVLGAAEAAACELDQPRLGATCGITKRGNLAVLLGMALAAAVLTGALVVGDSLRGSLRDRVLNQLGWVERAMVTGRFFREGLGEQLGAARAAPAILVQGAATRETSSGMMRAPRISILAVDERFWNGTPSKQQPAFWNGDSDAVVLNQSLATELDASVGDTVSLHLQKVSLIPRETLLGSRSGDDVVDELRLTVRSILPDAGMAQFSLRPGTTSPLNAFLPLGFLQEKLKQPGHVNALFVAGVPADFQDILARNLTLDDWGLVLRDPDSRTKELFDKLDRNKDGKLTRNEWTRRVAESIAQAVDRNKDGVLDFREVLSFFLRARFYLSLESKQMILERAVAAAALEAAPEAGLMAAPTLVYLANTIGAGAKQIPYGVVAALNPALPPPLGSFLPPGVKRLQRGDIVLADWKEFPLDVKPGQEVTLSYFPPVHDGKLVEEQRTFRLAGQVPLAGVADDPDLTPEFPGITDKLNIRDWNPPFPYDNKRVGKAEERFWEEHRTTPRAYIALTDGQWLWGSRFGQLTSVRLAPLDPLVDLSDL